MRTAQNPNKTAKVKPFAPLVVCAITHLPEMTSNYHRTRLDVIKHSLTTLTDNINMKPDEYDILIWDNGSCQELRDWLDTWVCKRVYTCNVGKTNALKYVMRMLPPDTILAYADDDIEYFPGWLAPQIEILRTFPGVGTVSGWPVRIAGAWGVKTAESWEESITRGSGFREDEVFEYGRFLPDAWERDYCDSVGRDWEQYRTATWGVMDYRITYKGLQVYAMGQHCQFVCYPERLEPLIPWTDEAMAQEIPFDESIDAAGLLRLCTVDRLTRHIGNAL